MALQSPAKPTPSASAAAVAPHKKRVAKPVKQTMQKDAQSNQKRKTMNATRNRMKEHRPFLYRVLMRTGPQTSRAARGRCIDGNLGPGANELVFQGFLLANCKPQ